MTEEWRSVAGYDGAYEVSNLGGVRSVARIIRQEAIFRGKSYGFFHRSVRARDLKTRRRKSDGRVVVSLSKEGVATVEKVATLVAAAFIGPCPEGLLVLHGDGDNGNNRSGNLRYGTQKENVSDAIEHGVFVIGEQRTQAKLTDAQAAAVKRLRSTMGRQSLADAFGVSRNAIRQIDLNRTWTHVEMASWPAAKSELNRRSTQ